MRIAIGLALFGLVAIVTWLFLSHDLRGWPSAYGDPPRYEATLPGGASFTLTDCVPGAIDRYSSPTLEEYPADQIAAPATVTVLTCRSRSSAFAIVIAYLLAASGALFLLRVATTRASR